MMSGPRPLFDKVKETLVGNSQGPKTPPQKKVGAFVPPAQAVQTEKKPEPKKTVAGPSALFQSKKTTELDVTPEDKVKFKDFDTRAIMKIKDASESIDLTDRASVIQYGQELNRKLAASVDEILKFVKTSAFADSVNTDVKKLQALVNFNPAVEEDLGFFGAFKKKRTLAERINEVVDAVESISQSVDRNVQHFLGVIPKLDDLLDGSKSYHSELLVLIAGGKDRIAVFNRRRRPRLDEKISGSNMMEAQNARDEMDIFHSFEKRIETLELSLGQNELTLAQIRMSQSTNVKIVESLNNIISNMIPLWKHSLISAISTNNFDAVNKNKDLLSKSICDIMSPTAAQTN